MSAELMRTRRRLIFASIVALIAACGGRTGLLVPEEDAGPEVDAGPDVILHKDSRPPEEDAREEDALPPIDVRPPVDVTSDCPDAASTLIYVITDSNDLYSFYPPAGSAGFNQIGKISCPITIPNEQPFSMAVDHDGIAYVVFSVNASPTQAGELFRVSTATAACQATSFIPGQGGFSHTFGMAFSADKTDAGETLYVASDESPPELATIDVHGGFALNVVGGFNPPITQSELTGTGAGDLFGFWAPAGPQGSGSAIVQIDKATAQVTGSSPLPGVTQGNGWAFGFWGGDFYTFTSPTGQYSLVTRFRPSDGSITNVAQTAPGEVIVGAGVSTCAPQQ
jgi:hypothetical protein